MAQFHFVLKTPESSSLSHGDDDENYDIRCHAQSRRRAITPRSRSPNTAGLPHTLPTRPFPLQQQEIGQEDRAHKSHYVDLRPVMGDDVQLKYFQFYGPSKQAVTGSCWHCTFQRLAASYRQEDHNPRPIIANNSFDPFSHTLLSDNPTTLQIFQFMCSDFTMVNFRAEALSINPSAIATKSGAFRHDVALSERIQTSLHNDMVMVSTLAYASAAMGWRFGIRYQQFPPEYFIQRACRAVRHRLNESKSMDNHLIMSIYALCVSEMWVRNYDAASIHLKMIRKIVEQVGGMKKLDAYVMESLILGSKFLALCTMSPPLLPLDWDPPPWPPEKMSLITSTLPSNLLSLGTAFFAPKNTSSIITPWYRTLLTDLIHCIYLSNSIWSPSPTHPNTHPDPADEQYLYLKTQALSHRLLSRGAGADEGDSNSDSDSDRGTLLRARECLRIALLLWLLSVTDYVGARMCAVELLPWLRATVEAVEEEGEGEVVDEGDDEASSEAQKQEEDDDDDDDDLWGLRLWINSLGAMVALSASLPGTKCDSHSDAEVDGGDEMAEFFVRRVVRAVERIRVVGLRREEGVERMGLRSDDEEEEDESDTWRRFLGRYLYLERRQGRSLALLVRAVRRLRAGAWARG